MNNAEDAFDATPVAIHKLQLILSNVEENDGKMVPGEMWRDEDTERELVLNSTGDRNTAISSARSVLKREEDLLAVVSFLGNSLEKRISSFRSRMPKTLTDLPDELITLILDFSEPGLNDLNRILQVCKRIRRLALSSPRLWARQWLTPRLSSYSIGAIAKRSGVLGLKAGFDTIPEARHAIFQHCERWTALHLGNLFEEDVTRFMSCVPCGKLSGLKSLYLDIQSVGSHIWPLNSTWTLPSLDTLGCLSFTSILQCLQTSALTSCALDFHYVLPNDKLAAFLSSCPSLERLTLSLYSVTKYGELKPIETSLPALKYFSLISVDVHAVAIHLLFRSLMFPNAIYALAAFRTGPMLGDIAVNNCYCTLLLAMRSTFPVLKDARLQVNSGGSDKPDMSIQTVLTHLPESLQDLTLMLENVHLQIFTFIGDGDVPFGGKLRSIAITKCNRLEPMFFEDMARLFEKHGVGKVALEVKNCSEVDDVDYVSDESEETVSSSPGLDLFSFSGYIEAGQMYVTE